MAGLVTGMVLAPAFTIGGVLRRGRLFHPEGVCYQAAVAPLATQPQLKDLVDRLTGSALVRLSSAIWRYHEWPDVLGCSIRFGLREPITEAAPVGAQDLLFATIPSLWLLPMAPFMTRQHDFLENEYSGGAPFEIAELGLVRLELWPEPIADERGVTREQKVDKAIVRGSAAFVLRAQPVDPREASIPLVEIRLQKQVQLDQAALFFSPFRNGMGIRPRGFVQAMRRPVYALEESVRKRLPRPVPPPASRK
jgi:hypothetical protein